MRTSCVIMDFYVYYGMAPINMGCCSDLFEKKEGGMCIRGAFLPIY